MSLSMLFAGLGAISICRQPVYLHIVMIKLVVLIGVIHALPMSSLMFPEERSVIQDDEPKTIPSPILTVCPNGSWYHNETSSCHPSKLQGPCSPSMIFFAVDRRYGECDCRRNNIQTTAWVYDLDSDRCFKSYEQAYCKTGEWLIFSNATGEPVCVPNKCKVSQGKGSTENEENHVVLFHDECVRLGKPDKSCSSSEEIVIISVNSGKPVCSSDLSDRDLNPTGFRCRPGTKRDRLGKCRGVNSKVTFRPSS